MLGRGPLSASPLSGAALAPVYTTGFSWPMMWIGSGSPAGWVNTDGGDVIGITEPDANSTLLFSKNPALVTADVIYRWARKSVDWANVGAAADFDDEVFTGEGGSQPRSELTLLLNQKQGIEQWRDALRSYIPGWVIEANGKHLIIPDKEVASSHTFTSGMIDGSPLPRVIKRGVRDTPNVIEIEYTDARTIPFKTDVVPAENVPPGADRRKARYSMPGIRSRAQANRFAIEKLNHVTTEGQEVEFPVFDYGVRVLPGEIAELTEAAFGWTAQEIRVLSVKDRGNGRWTIGARIFSPLAYNETVVTEIPQSGSSLPSPLNVPQPASPVMTEELYQDYKVGGYQSRMKITWTESSTYPYGDHYRVEIYEGSELIVTGTAKIGLPVFRTSAVKEGSLYTARIRLVSSIGIASSAAEASATALGKQALPGDVPFLTAFEIGGEVLLKWGEAVDIDIMGYELRAGPVGVSWDDAVFLQRFPPGIAGSYKGLAAGDYDLLLKAFDSVRKGSSSIGQYSANAAVATVTITLDANSFLAAEVQFTAGTGDITPYMPENPSNEEWLHVSNRLSGAGSDFNSIFGSAMNTYANPLLSYQSSGGGVATYTTEEYDIGAVLSGTFIATWLATLLDGSAVYSIGTNDGSGYVWTAGTSFKGAARYVKLKVEVTGGDLVLRGRPKFVVSVVPREETHVVNSSALGAVTVNLTGKYFAAIDIQVTAQSNTFAVATYDNVSLSLVATNTVDIYVRDNLNNLISKPVRLSFKGT